MYCKEEDVNDDRTDTLKKKEDDILSISEDGLRKIDINKLQCSRLPFNPSVAMPNSIMQEEEIKFQRFKDEVKTISTKHRKKTKDLSN